jgi:putative membrane protein
MTKLTLLLLALTAAAPPATPEPAPDASMVLTRLHQINMAEVKAGELARRKGSTPRVRRYGDLLARDHAFADRRLLALAQDRGIAVAAAEPREKDKAAARALETASGPEFDKRFTDAMHAGHAEAITALESVGSGDRKLDRLVEKLLPVLRQHLRLAHDLGGRAAQEDS